MFIQKVGGHKVVFYSTRELGTILGRTTVTIMKWTKKGYLPAPEFVRTNSKYNFITKENNQQISLYSEQEVNALLALIDKWEITKFTKVGRLPGFAQEVAYAWGQIRETIKQGKVDTIDYGFILKFNNREEAEELMKKILKSTKRPNQTLDELSKAITRELIQYRDVNLTSNIKKRLES